MAATKKTAAQMRPVITQVSESLYLDLLQMQNGQLTPEKYAERMGIWMRLLADNTGTDRGYWEVPA